MSDRIVPVRSYLTTATYRALDARARQLGATVPQLLAQVADDAAAGLHQPQQRKRRAQVDEDRAARIAELHDLGWSPSTIAQEVGVSRATVYRHIPPTEGERP